MQWRQLEATLEPDFSALSNIFHALFQTINFHVFISFTFLCHQLELIPHSSRPGKSDFQSSRPWTQKWNTFTSWNSYSLTRVAPVQPCIKSNAVVQATGNCFFFPLSNCWHFLFILTIYCLKCLSKQIFHNRKLVWCHYTADVGWILYFFYKCFLARANHCSDHLKTEELFKILT